MTVSIRRSFLLSAVPVGLFVSTLAGCGGLTAVKDPAFAAALSDPAPMSVVARRAQDASHTSDEVNRLLSATPVSASSDWLKHVGPDMTVVTEDLAATAEEPMFKDSHAKVMSAEVWAATLPTVKSAKGDKQSLLALLSPALGDAFASLVGKQAEVEAMTALIDQEKQTLAQKDISADDRAEHESTLQKLQKMQADSAADVAPDQKAFLAKATDAASHLPQDQKDKLAPAVANLLQALADADAANNAAALRYPLAAPTATAADKAAVPGLVAANKNTLAFQTEMLTDIMGGLSSDPGAVQKLAVQIQPADGAAAAVDTPAVAVAVATPAVPAVGLKVPAVPAGAGSALAMAGKAGALAKDPKGAAMDMAKEGLGAAAGKVPGGGAALALAGGLPGGMKVPGAPGLPGAAGPKLPGLPAGGASALAMAGANAAASKIPGGGTALAFAGHAAALAKDPKGAALELAKDAAGVAAQKVPGGAAALGAANAAMALAKDPKGAAKDMAKDAAGAAMKKIPGAGAFSSFMK